MIAWRCKRFNELTPEELYEIIRLRIEVFVVEQNCPYQDCDEKDHAARHFGAWENNCLLAYTRLLPAGVSYEEAASIGRVVTSPAARGSGLGKELMRRSIEEIYRLYGRCDIRISAQLYLQHFYESFSFVRESDVYQEDGIDHIRMILKA